MAPTSKFVLYICMTVDGYIAETDGGVQFLDKYEGADTGYNDFIETVDVCIMGRKTFEQVMDFPVPWPYPKQKTYVLSAKGTSKSLPPNVETHAGPVTALIEDLKKDHAITGKIWIVGGSQICREFLDADAIDELEIYIAPELLGNGVRLFVNDSKNPDAPSVSKSLRLQAAQTLEKGFVKLCYERA